MKNWKPNFPSGTEVQKYWNYWNYCMTSPITGRNIVHTKKILKKYFKKIREKYYPEIKMARAENLVGENVRNLKCENSWKNNSQLPTSRCHGTKRKASNMKNKRFQSVSPLPPIYLYSCHFYFLYIKFHIFLTVLTVWVFLLLWWCSTNNHHNLHI